MPSDAYLRHFQHPRGQGGLDAPTHAARVEDGTCGDELGLDLEVRGTCVGRARFRVRGCSGAIAAASALVTLLEGRPARPGAVTREELERELGGVPPGKGHAVALALAALAAALGSPSSGP